MTNKEMKIVVVGTFDRHKAPFHPTREKDDYYVASWGALWARRVKKRYPEADIEVWRPEAEFTTTSQRTVYGVPCTIFPYRMPVISDIITLEMLRILRRYQQSHNLVVHLNTIFDYRFNLLAPWLLPRTRFILSHHGGKIPAGTNLKSRLKRKIQHLSFRNIHTVTYLRREVRDWIGKRKNPPHLEFLPVGADFDIFRPEGKAECRKKLGLDPSKTYAIYVGAFYNLKGVDKILSVCDLLRNENFGVIFVGGTPKDELYDKVVKSGNPFWGYVSQRELATLYSAADFYIHPVFNPKFGGFDVSVMEALACDIPVLTSMFKELDFDFSNLGYGLDDENEIMDMTNQMIKDHSTFRNCRESASVHFNGNTSIIDKLYQQYINIFTSSEKNRISSRH